MQQNTFSRGTLGVSSFRDSPKPPGQNVIFVSIFFARFPLFLGVFARDFCAFFAFFRVFSGFHRVFSTLLWLSS